MTIAIIDYGVGNLGSVEKAFTSQGIAAGHYANRK
jgi:imidazoleglycerol phosphate synthase glutamine amidotransferase subunit HisH